MHYDIFSLVTIVVFFYEILTNEITDENIQTILNSYNVIQIAFASIAFVAMSMKAAEKSKFIYNNLFALSLFSIIALGMDLLLFYASFLGITHQFLLNLVFAANDLDDIPFILFGNFMFYAIQSKFSNGV